MFLKMAHEFVSSMETYIQNSKLDWIIHLFHVCFVRGTHGAKQNYITNQF